MKQASQATSQTEAERRAEMAAEHACSAAAAAAAAGSRVDVLESAFCAMQAQWEVAQRLVAFPYAAAKAVLDALPPLGHAERDSEGDAAGASGALAPMRRLLERVVASLAPLVGTGDSGDFGQCNREEAPVDATLLLAIASHIRKLELRADTDSGAVSPATCSEAATSSAAQADCLPSTTSFLRPTQSPSAEPSWCEAMGEGQAL